MSSNQSAAPSAESTPNNIETADERESSESFKSTIITIIITSVLTTLGTFAVTTYQQSEQQNTWLAQQKYIEENKKNDEKRKTFERLIDLNSKKFNLKSNFFSLYFQAQVFPSLNRKLDEGVIDLVKKSSEKLEETKVSLEEVNSEFVNLLVKSRILFDDSKGNEIINLLKHNSNPITVSDVEREFNHKVNTGEITSSNFEEMYIKYRLLSSASAIDTKYNEKFNEMIKFMVDDYRQK